MQNLTTCVETAMALAPVPPPYELETRCAQHSPNLTLSIEAGKYYIGSLQSSRVWFSHPRREEKDPTCANDLPLGQLRFKDNVCFSKLDPSISSQLNLKIKSLVEVTDIRFKQNKAWMNLAESRHSVYLAMFTGVVSVLGSCAAAISHRLMDIEKHLEKKLQDYRKSESRWKRIIGVALNSLGNHWIKFFYRASLLVVSAFSALFAVYDGTMGGIKDRNLVHAQTVTMSMSQGTTVLVTTTATSEVSPVLTSFVVFLVFTCLVIIGSLYWVGHMLDTIGGISDEDSTRRSQGGSARICPEEMDEIIASQKP